MKGILSCSKHETVESKTLAEVRQTAELQPWILEGQILASSKNRLAGSHGKLPGRAKEPNRTCGCSRTAPWSRRMVLCNGQRVGQVWQEASRDEDRAPGPAQAQHSKECKRQQDHLVSFQGLKQTHITKYEMSQLASFS